MNDITLEKIDKINQFLGEEQINEADILFAELNKEPECEEATICILDASIGMAKGDRERAWKAISNGLKNDCKNAELYVLLGNYYLEENLEQAYLCYEQALFYCDDAEDKVQIQEMLLWLQEEGVVVNRVSFVILSYDLLDYTKLCIESIRATVPREACEIVVIDNGSKDGSVEWLRYQDDIVLLENEENVGFPKGCNQGIAVSSANADVMLLNNDTILPANAIFWLRMGLYENSQNGTAGSVSNYVGNLQMVADGIQGEDNLIKYGEENNIPMKNALENKLFLIGFALLIRREIIELVGGLDERFSPGNSEDEDYGLQVLCAGYKNVLCKNSFIFHFGSKSFGKNRDAYQNILQINRAKLNSKWGFETVRYLYPQKDICDLIGESTDTALNVLEVGCGCGANLGYIKGRYPQAEIFGLEKDAKLVQLGNGMATICCDDLSSFKWENNYFDYIILNDEGMDIYMLIDLLSRAKHYLKKHGCVILSVTNIKHYSFVIPFIRKNIIAVAGPGQCASQTYKFYSNENISYIIQKSGFEIETWAGVRRGTPGDDEKRIIDTLTSLMENPDKDAFLIQRYIGRLRLIENET